MAKVNAEPGDLRARLEAALGWPGPLTLRAADPLARRPVPGGTLSDLVLTLSDDTAVRAFRIDPDRPVGAAILYCHAHGNRYATGCEELVAGRPSLLAPWGPELAQAGIATLCLEMPCFGQRQAPGEGALAKRYLWQGKTLFGRMLAELRAGLGWLARDHDRLGALGFSMGGTHAWWLATLDDRVAAAAGLGAFADLGTLVRTGAHDLHGIYMVVPGLTALAPTGTIAALAAPRALFVGGGFDDPGTPRDAVETALAPLRAAYATTPDRLEIHYEDGLGHCESPALRAAARTFLLHHLGTAP